MSNIEKDYTEVKLNIPTEFLKDKNSLLGSIIRNSKVMISNEKSIPGEMQEFGTETPLSAVELQEKFNLEPAIFSYHFRNFLKRTENEVDSLFNTKVVKIYPISVARGFLAYMNRNGNKYNITI